VLIASPRRNRELGAIPVIQSRRLIRQMHAPVFANLDVGRDHDFPGMVIGIGKISGIAAVISLMRRLQQRRSPCEIAKSMT
jgi:hypothetical protein